MKINVYDFDNTIYNGDSSLDFFKFCLKKNHKCLLVLPKLFIVVVLYILKIYEKEKFKSCFFSIVKYFDDIDKIVDDFWKLNDNKIKDFYLKQKNESDIIISASPEFLLEPIANKYGFRLIASKVDKKTGKFLSNNCYGEEKVNRLYQEMNINSIDEFYSDSLSDEPLNKISNKSFIVKKDTLINWSDYKESSFKKMFLSRDFFVFIFIGMINALNGVWIAYVFSLFIANAVLAYMCGFLVSLTIAYILNSVFNFKMSLSIKNYFKFCLSNIPNFIIQMTSVFILYDYLKLHKLISYAISSVIAVPITFILIKLHVFKKNK